jgi:hypothetical protein
VAGVHAADERIGRRRAAIVQLTGVGSFRCNVAAVKITDEIARPVFVTDPP